MTTQKQQQQSQLKQLIALGKEQGYLTYAEVNDHLPESITDTDQVEDIIQMINDMGITVVEKAADADQLMIDESADSTDEVAAEEAAAVLASVESEPGRTTDPVRMYMREMGTVELLTREGEIEIAKRIEEGTREVLHALAFWPGAVDMLITEYARVENEERKLTDQRSKLSPDAFSGLADAFDEKVQKTRAAQAAKGRALNELVEKERQVFLAAAGPVLEQMMREAGAAVILERRSVFVSANAIDITDEAIERLDASVGSGKN